MTGTLEIVCRRCGQRKQAFASAPLPGKWGAIVREQTCPDCWREWVDEQTRVINHEHLQPSQPAHRAVLYERMAAFLKLER
ncbi:MAG: Fe(2+)-trafficking protein [Chloroflexi bacterium]|nr:Fe(2+)-trafficking protein [Chloroflexota bacterium]